MLDLERVGDDLSGCVFVTEADQSKPATFAKVSGTATARGLLLSGAASPCHPTEGRFLRQEELVGLSFPTTISADLSVDRRSLKGQWTTDIGSVGDVILVPSRSREPSEIEAEGGVISWEEAQRQFTAISDPQGRFVFRGQSQPWRIVSAFHRTSRKDLYRYWNTDVPDVRRSIEGTLGHDYDLGIPDRAGSFMHLLQHHGYPTPLIDWTKSPYIAAYFAFSSSRRDANPNEQIPVRIYRFDVEEWRKVGQNSPFIVLTQPHLTFMSMGPLGNPRSLPQQALAALTNIDDIESYVTSAENKYGRRFIWAYDIAIEEREKALRHLALMGITAASLFPGLDGLCEEFRDRHFSYLQ